MYIFGEEYIKFLQSNLTPAHPASGMREIQTRCKYCPDSSDPRSKGHMYISIPQDETEISMFYCQKCGAKGIIDNDVLMSWGIYSDIIGASLFNHNKTAFKYSKNNKFQDREVYYLRNDFITQDELSDSKLKYINDRLGVNLNYKDLCDLKIALNISDLLERNKITKYTRSMNILNQIDKYFLGFISADNAFLNMRLLAEPGVVYDTIDKRYINYNIFNKFNNTERFYTIPGTIPMGLERTKIHVAEGPFDILSILLNLRYDEYNKSIFTSIAGGGYSGLIYYFITKFKLPFIELHLYPDNDKIGSDDRLKYLVYKLNNINIPVYIHRNVYPGEKDFGVSKNKIEERIYQL